MNTNKILSNILMGVLFLVLFIPLFVSDSMFFPFITGKNFAFRIIVEILLSAWIVLAYRDPAYRPTRSPLFIAAASFVGIITLAGVLGENPYKSFRSNYERMEGTISLLHFFAYFVMATTALGARKKWGAFWNTSILVSFIIGVYALFQLSGALAINQGGVRVDATFGNAAYLAVYLLFHIFITLFMLLREKGHTIGGMIAEKASLWIYTPIILLDVFVLYHTATRGAILGLIGGLLLTALLIAIFEKERVGLRKVALGILAGIVLLIGGFFALKNTSFITESPVLSRFSSISLTEQTTKSRFMVWNMAFQGFKERPILGWGQENFNFVFNKYYDPNMYGQEPWFDRAHNVFFDWLIAGGILGLLAYLSLFVLALWDLWKRGSAFSIVEKAIFTGLLAGYFFQNIFVFDNIGSYIMFFSILAFFHFSFGNPFPDKWQKTIDKKFELFEKALAYDSFGSAEIREQLSQMALSVGASQAPVEWKQKYFDLARSEFLKQIEVPRIGDARYELFLGSFLTRFQRYDEALAHLNKALEFSPKKQIIMFEIGLVHISTSQYDKALEIFRQAYELEKNYPDARNYYAVAAIYAGKNDLVKSLLEPVYGTI